MTKQVTSRMDAEAKENLESISNDVPENRQQAVQQIAKTSDAEGVKAPSTGFQSKQTKGKGSTLKQQIISDMITGSSQATGMGINFAGRDVSGTSSGVLGANNSTPDAGKSRQGTRVGKKLDRIATKLNFTPCETALLAVDESKPLADAADLDQGYNGTYRNEFARSQKIAGAVPGDLMYQRSVDLIMKDKLYFVEGQQVFQDGDDRTGLNPDITIDPSLPESKQEVKVTYHSGNYLHENLHIGLKSDGSAKYCYFDVKDLTHSAVTAESANVSSAHRLIKSNVAELDRMNMDAKAGDEKAEIWSPLPRAVKNPTKTSYLMSSIEADTGAYAYLAYAKASTNMAYQLNRAAKDGLDVLTPAVEQCVGWRAAVGDSKIITNESYFDKLEDVFTAANYRLGDPSLLINAYDSDKKYNNKADLLLQPRGWRMHLQTADNNINPLYVPKEFANVYSATEVFSTIDHDYDPLLPVCMTDKANLITVHNINELAGFVNYTKGCTYAGTWTKLDPSKSDYEKTEEVMISANDLMALKGLGYSEYKLYFFYKSNGTVAMTIDNSVSEADGNGLKTETLIIGASGSDGNRSVSVKIVLAPANAAIRSITPTGYDHVSTSEIAISGLKAVLFSVPKVQSHTYNAVTVSTYTADADTTEYAVGSRPFVYRYSDIRNKYIVEVKHPLVEGILLWLKESIGSKIHSLIEVQDFKIPFIFSTQYMTLAQLVICAAMPWIARVRANSMKDVIYYQDNVKEYPYSKLANIKDVPFKNYVNFIYRDYDSPLETKVMDPVRAINWVLPEFFWKVDTGKYVSPWYMNELELDASDGSVNEDASCMSMPSIRSGYRLGLLDLVYGMSEKDVRLSLDRMTKELFNNSDIATKGAYKYGLTTDGQVFIVMDTDKVITINDILSCPRELGLSMDCPLGVLTRDPADVVGTNYFSADLKAFSSEGVATSYRIKCWTNSMTNKEPSILAAAGININRAANYAQRWFELTANAGTSNTTIAGLVFGLGDEGAATYIPFATLGDEATQDTTNGATIISYQRSINTRLQFLPFVISPFDAVFTSGSTYSRDIYDVGYYFGLAGFRASDYRESVYNREKEVVNQGILFVEDPWVIDSPIIREGAKSTGIMIGKGYSL